MAIHVRPRCYGKIAKTMADIHSLEEVFCPTCKRMVDPGEFANTVPMSSLISFRDIVVTEENKNIIDFFLQWSHQEVPHGRKR